MLPERTVSFVVLFPFPSAASVITAVKLRAIANPANIQ